MAGAGEATAPAVPTVVPGEVRVLEAFARAAPMAGGNGAAFLLVQNGLEQPVQFVSALSSVSDATELHESIEEGGVVKMVPHPEGFVVPAGETLVLQPGGKHVMFLGLKQPLAAGEAISLTLTFSPEQTIELTVPVVEIGASMEMMGGESGDK